MDFLAAVGDPELREALLYARGQARPVTADELASAKGVHRNVARSRLERLAEAGLLAPGYERRSGKAGPGAGSPAKTYAVVPQLESIEFPASHFESLAAMLVDAVAAKGGRKQLREIGVDFGRELGRASGVRPVKKLEPGFERLCEAVRSLGYQASRRERRPGPGRDREPDLPAAPARPRAARGRRDRPRHVGGPGQLRALGRRGTAVSCETRDCFDDHASCKIRLRAALSF